MAYLLFTRSFNHCIKSSSWRDVTTFSHGYRCHSQLTLNLLRTQRSKFPLTHFQIASIRFSASTKCRFISRPFIQTSYGHLQKAFHNYHRKNWSSGGYWWSWWEALVRSINRRCLLCAGAIFLWDRERITNKEIKETLSKYEKRVSGYSEQKSRKETSTDEFRKENNDMAYSGQLHCMNGKDQDEWSSDKTKTAATGLTEGNRKQENSKAMIAEEDAPHNQGSNRREMKRSGPNKGKSESVGTRKRMKDRQTSTHTHSSSRKYKNSRHSEKTKKGAVKPGSEAQVNGEEWQDKQQKRKKEMNTECDSQEHENAIKSNEEENAGGSQPKPSHCEEEREANSPLLSSIDKAIDQGEDPLKGWEVAFKQDNCTVYSKPYGNTGLLQYKAIGFYDDITARDYLDVQIGDDRMSWDSYCLELNIVDRDPSTGSEVVHWVLKYPFPMTSRDYVFVRRHWISSDDNAIILINRAVEHPAVPESRKHVRVKSYFSEAVIKPDTFIDELGFHYELTYFDDPGTYIPSSAVTWVTKSAMPDFLGKIHKAALQRQAPHEDKHAV